MAKKVQANPFLNPTTPTSLPFEKPTLPVTPVPKPAPTPTNTGGGIIRSGDPGREGVPAGITLSDGTTLLGLTPQQVEAMAKIQLSKKGGQATQQFEAESQQKAQAQMQVQNQELVNQANEKGFVTEEDVKAVVPQEKAIEGVTTAGGALAGALAGGGTGAGIGAGIGSIVPGPGTAIGAGVGGVIGAVVGAIGGAYTKITLDKRGDVKQAKKVATIANRNFGQTIDALNAGIITPEVALQRWKRDQASLYAARENLKRETDKDLNRFLSGGADELADTEGYIQDLEEIYQTEFNAALLFPNPQKIKYSFAQTTEEE